MELNDKHSSLEQQYKTFLVRKSVTGGLVNKHLSGTNVAIYIVDHAKVCQIRGHSSPQ